MIIAGVPRFARLRTQLTLALVLPTFLVGILMGAPLIESRRSVLMAQEQRRAAQAGEAAALLFTERLRSGVQIANLLADRQILTEQLRLGDLHNLQRFLATTRVDTPFACLAVVDPNGTTLAQVGSCATVALVTPTPAIRFHSAADVGLTAQIAARIMVNTALRGYLIGTIPIDRGLVDAARTQPDLELGVVVDGVSVASSLATRDNTTSIPSIHDGSIETTIQRQPYLAYYTTLTNLDGQPVAQAEVLLPLAPVWAAQFTVTLLMLAGLMIAVTLAIAIGWVVAKRIAQLVGQLSQATEAIGRGDLEQPIRVEGPVEIRHLGMAIEWMRQQLARSRSELEAEKQRYADILESIDEAVLTINAALCVTSINQGGERMLGCPRSVAVGLPLSAVVAPDDGRALLLSDIPRHGSARIAVRTYGHQALMVSAARSIPLQRDEQILVLRDVSEDAALRQLKDAFLANITHEFRTPLAAQIASLEILREEGASLTAAEQRQMLDVLYTGVQRLDLLVQNLLESASIEAGYFRVDPEPCRLDILVTEAIELIQPLIRQRHQRIVVTMAPDLPPVRADGQRMVQVLLNLLSNASKFGPYGDTITIQVAHTETAWVTVSVTDHGPGVPASQRERLFERFVRPGVQTLPSQGAGLGLAIVKAIIDRHGGTVIVRDGVPSGMTMQITIPVAERGAR